MSLVSRAWTGRATAQKGGKKKMAKRRGGKAECPEGTSCRFQDPTAHHQHLLEFSHTKPKAHDWGDTNKARKLGGGARTLSTGGGRGLSASSGRKVGGGSKLRNPPADKRQAAMQAALKRLGERAPSASSNSSSNNKVPQREMSKTKKPSSSCHVLLSKAPVSVIESKKRVLPSKKDDGAVDKEARKRHASASRNLVDLT